MKVRKLKTRIAAFGLAVLMGISTLSSANAFAAEQTGSEQQTEVQASEQAVTSHLTARIQPLLRGHKYRVLSLFGSCLWLPKQNPNLFWRDLGKKAKDIVRQLPPASEGVTEPEL